MTTEELEKKITIIEHDFTVLKAKNYKLEVKFEALLRHLIWEGNISAANFTIEKYHDAVTNFQLLNNKVMEINKIASISDKVEASYNFNKISHMKIHGDDLGLQIIIENAGGTTDFTARHILEKIPCSKTLTTFLEKFVKTKTDDDKVILFPNQVVS